MKRILLFVLLLALVLAGCSAETKEKDHDTSGGEVEITGNVFLDAETKSSLSSGGGIRNYITVSKEDAQAADAEDYSDFIKMMKLKAPYVESFSIVFDDGTGVIYYGCDPINAEYGKMDSSGVLVEGLGFIMPQEDGTYKFVKYTD